MAKIINIYCEGKAGSHDYDILEKVTDGLTGIEIKPIGGKTGAKSAIQVYEKLAVKSDFKIFFRDRDFDAAVPEKPALTNLDSYIYCSYLPTIENYFLGFETFFDFFNSQNNQERTLIKVRYIKAAKSIKHHQAVRHTLGKMRIPTDFGSNICDRSGTLPNSLDFEFCRLRGLEKIIESNKKIENWTKDKFDTILQEFEAIFNDDFFDNLAFLPYFQGKDFATALGREFNGLSTRNLYKKAKANFDYSKYADLVELRTLIEQHL